jgi:hypothetical protein
MENTITALNAALDAARAALNASSPVEGIIILDIIRMIADARMKTVDLDGAMKEVNK